ncbi:MAG TPA: hypothetical protein V6D47_16840 [Oscillatoriaceae cyanobacterium]
MKSTTKLFAAVVFAAAFTAGCNGMGLPNQTGNTTDPGFTGSVTMNGSPASGVTVFLKQWNNGKAGTFNGTSGHVGTQYQTTTDSQGNYFLPVPKDAVTGGGLYGVGYDASLSDSTQKTADNNKNGVLWFTSPAYDLSSQTGNRVSVSFDTGWSAAAFSPANGASIQPTNGGIAFTLPSYPHATGYEVDITSGSVAGSGSAVDGSPLKGTSPQLTWNNPSNGTYNYEAKVTTSSGMAGIADNQAASPYLVFTVTGAQ